MSSSSLSSSLVSTFGSVCCGSYQWIRLLSVAWLELPEPLPFLTFSWFTCLTLMMRLQLFAIITSVTWSKLFPETSIPLTSKTSLTANRLVLWARPSGTSQDVERSLGPSLSHVVSPLDWNHPSYRTLGSVQCWDCKDELTLQCVSGKISTSVIEDRYKVLRHMNDWMWFFSVVDKMQCIG